MAARSEVGARGAATVISSRGGICAVNDAFERATGFTSQELLGAVLPSLAHPDSRDRLERQIRQHFGGPPAAAKEDILLVGKHGQPIWTEHTTGTIELAGDLFAVSTFMALGDDRGRPAQASGEWQSRRAIDEDVTGRAMCTPDWTIVDCNRALAQMLGFEESSHLTGRRLLEFATDPMPLQKLIALTRADKKAGPVELQLERRDGEGLHVSVTLVGSFDASGRLVSVRGQLLEVTESKRLQMRLLGVQRMEAIGRLAGGLAHEFNNLLTVIAGHAERLSAALPGEHQLKASANAIRTATDRAASLTRQLLAFSRRQVFELQPVAVHHLVQQAQPLLAKILGDRVALRLDLPLALPDISVDSRQIELVVVNLAKNAREAMTGDGTLTILVDEVEIGERPPRERPWLRPGRYVRLVIADTGPGMEPSTKAHVFEPFFTTKHIGSGAGLGLATVYGIVKQSNGFVWVDSEIGRGAAFTLLFPVLERDSVERSRTRDAGTETILVVDEDERVRTFVADALRRRGYQVLDAPSGAEAIELFAAHPARIHLLVADAQSAAAGGVALDRRLKTIDPMMQTLVMVEPPGPRPVPNSVRPSTPTIQKPFTLQALADRIRAVLDSGEGRG